MTTKIVKLRDAPVQKGFGLVRDKDGNPVIDGDLKRLPAGVKIMLPPDERIAHGVWPHEFGTGSQGEVKLQAVDDTTFTAMGAVVALSAIYVHGKNPMYITPRTDLSPGDVLKIEEE